MPSGTVQELLDTLPQIGRVEWIGISPRRRGDIQSVHEAKLQPGTGIEGDHHANGGGRREVTFIQHEHLPAVAGMLGRETLPPELLRRNIVVSGLNLAALKGRTFRVGEAALRYEEPCEPCSLMEHNLGTGGYNAMRGHGGIIARVVTGGVVRVGDPVTADA